MFWRPTIFQICHIFACTETRKIYSVLALYGLFFSFGFQQIPRYILLIRTRERYTPWLTAIRFLVGREEIEKGTRVQGGDMHPLLTFAGLFRFMQGAKI